MAPRVCIRPLERLVFIGILLGIAATSVVSVDSRAPPSSADLHKNCTSGEECHIELQCINGTCEYPCKNYTDTIWIDEVGKEGCKIMAGKYGCESHADCVPNGLCVKESRRKKRAVVIVERRRYYGGFRPRPYYGIYGFGSPFYHNHYYHRPHYYRPSYYSPPVSAPATQSKYGSCSCKYAEISDGTCQSTGHRLNLSVIALSLCGIMHLLIGHLFLKPSVS